ncbi:MAG: FAD:protein FMN transferase [Candidatus Marinimicrobia bacterium]|jgi:FAD:protein FMN transferase|nr:FAD:protein FMN transferase [Candidatus Neomarinimicrobiota bacterium]
MMILGNRPYLFILFLISCNSLDNSSKNNLYHFPIIAGNTMGTTYTVKYATDIKSSDDIKKNKDKVEEILRDINMQMSTYIDDSEISKFNRINNTEWMDISEDFAFVVQSSFQYHKISNGLYDITVMPLVNLWGFGPDKFLDIPTAADIDSVLSFVGQDLIEIYDNKIRKKDPRVEIDLSSIAKGYAVDKIITNLGYDNIFVEIGGEVRGKSDGKIWKIGINTPSIDNISNEIEYIAPIKNGSIATSGNYRNFYIDEDDRFYHHEINPLTGYPIMSKLASISVFTTTSCMEADGLATALYMMNFDDIQNFFNDTKFEGLMIFINPDMSFKQVVSRNFPKN